ncbi:MAG: carboxypeptidase regulatory-like domain-containing protein [Myxococcaceae bacterium]|nr:carboxypeptidase regulatory-like domain-containing protein [Myxococcaceae bacterium]
MRRLLRWGCGFVFVVVMLVAAVAFKLWRDHAEHEELREADRGRAPVSAPKLAWSPAPSAPGDDAPCLRGVVLEGEAPVGGMQVSVTDTAEARVARMTQQCGCRLCDCPEARAALFDDPRPGLPEAVKSVTSAGDGTFSLCGLTAAQPEFIWAEDASGRLAWQKGTLVPLRPGAFVELQVVPRRLVEGLVRKGGQPLPGARLLLVPDRPVRAVPATSDAQGRFRVEFPAGDGRALVEAPSVPAQLVAIEVTRQGTVVIDVEDAATLEVRVLHDGRPVEGAEVTVTSAPVLRTDAEGLARCAVSRTRGTIVRAKKGGLVAKASFRGDSAAVRRLELSLTPGVGLRGVIVDETGAPRAGRVRGASPDDATLATTPEGRFEVEPREVGERMFLVPLVEGCVSDEDGRGVVVTERAPEVKLVVRCAGAVRGTVVEAGGAPVPLAVVKVSSEGRDVESTTDERGGFTVHLRDGVPARVKVSHPRYRAEERPLVAPLTDELVIVLDAGGSISGRVVEGGAGVPDVEVMAVPGDLAELLSREGLDKHLTRTTADGRFVLRGLEAGRWVVIATLPGAPGVPSAPLVLQPAEQRTGVELSVSASSESIRGRVVDARGGPVANALVEWTPPENKAKRLRVMSEVIVGRFDTLMQALPGSMTTGLDGTFSIRGISEASVALEVSAKGFESQTVTGSKGELLQVTLQAKPAWRIAGRVVDDRGQPVPRFLINESDFGAADGRFEVDCRVDPQVLRVNATGFLEARREVRRSGEKVDLGDVELARGAALGLVVTTRDGSPLGEARVLGKQVDARSVCRTASDGRCTLEPLKAVPVEVRVVLEGFVPFEKTVAKDELARPLEVTLERATGRVSGQVFRAPGVPAAGQTVNVEAGFVTRTVVTDADGRFTATEVPEGDACVVTKLGVVEWAVPAKSTKEPASVAVGPMAGGATLAETRAMPAKVLLGNDSSPQQLRRSMQDVNANGLCRMAHVTAVYVLVIGSVRVEGLPPGPWSAFVFSAGDAKPGPDDHITPQSFELRSGETRSLE